MGLGVYEVIQGYVYIYMYIHIYMHIYLYVHIIYICISGYMAIKGVWVSGPNDEGQAQLRATGFVQRILPPCLNGHADLLLRGTRRDKP